MAYNSGDRFPPIPKYYTLLDPGAYQFDTSCKIKASKIPFSSNTPRNTQPGTKVWTDAIYYADLPPKIPNCTTMMSKLPRFPYEAFSKEDLEEILCKCGIENPCECPTEDQQKEEVNNCQSKVRRRIFKGPTPKSILGEGLSAPSKGDNGFKILPDGSMKRIKDEVTDPSPPFYDARVIESTAFYQGCKWSRWTSQRTPKLVEVRPGPGEYTFDRELAQHKICAEKFRSYRRQTSKQLRFIEMVQQKNLLEGRPSPATYSPILPKGTDLKKIGPKANRFPATHYDEHPGPANYWLRRDFDLLQLPKHPCHAKLPEPACFGFKSLRFKPKKEEGPSPASYCPNYKPCHFMNCSTAPFGSSGKRFTENPIDESDEEEIIIENEPQKSDEKDTINKSSPSPTWEFKSKTCRIKPLKKMFNEPSPADLPQSVIKIQRSQQSQYISPFYSSEGRFQPWFDWMPVYGKLRTPGPGYFNLEKLKCNPAVYRGPLCRAERFPSCILQTPAPNEYKVGRGIESILSTNNQKLKVNIENQHKFHWEPPVETRKLTFEEQETLLLHKSIALLEVEKDVDDALALDDKSGMLLSRKSSVKFENKKNPKLLRCFLYSQQVSTCF